MLIKTLWIWRKSEGGPEMIQAWDEYCVDDNFEGWQTACREALGSVQADLSDLGCRYVDISVDADKIAEMFWANETKGDVRVPPESA